MDLRVNKNLFVLVLEKDEEIKTEIILGSVSVFDIHMAEKDNWKLKDLWFFFHNSQTWYKWISNNYIPSVMPDCISYKDIMVALITNERK